VTDRDTETEEEADLVDVVDLDVEAEGVTESDM